LRFALFPIKLFSKIFERSDTVQSIAVIVGNRDFFPDHLVTEARKELVELCNKLNINPIMVSESDTKLGGVETFADAQKCADLFRQNRDMIQGLLVILPNFGDEKGVADAVRLSGLDCPILIQACPDELAKLGAATRRDGFCGKISVCNNLQQYGVPFSLTTKHVVAIDSDSFKSDLMQFLSVCETVSKLRRVRLGAVGARPSAFNTVRYSEKILERNGVSVSTVDLSEIFASIDKLGDEDAIVASELERISAYASTRLVAKDRLTTMAKLGVVLRDWIEENSIDALAFQCWTSIQQNIGINPCTVMSMLSQEMIPSACEVDITGVLTMYAMQFAAGSPAGIVDWNNNYADDENKCVFFHCGNWAKSLMGGEATICSAPILGSTVGEENTYGALDGRTPKGPMTFARLSTDDTAGTIRAYLGEGMFTNDTLETFGTRAVVEVPNLQGLLRYICENGFEHHVVMTRSYTAAILHEAFTKYLKWDTYRHDHRVTGR
jgi:L-fucose isomerase-like protein